MEQLRMKTLPIKSCAFTGHRELDVSFSPEKLWLAVEGLIQDGVEQFYCGMAMGFDLLAAEAVLFLKKRYPQIKLTACIPFQNQERYYSETDKARYARILKDADEKILFAEEYTKDAPLKRNRYMAEQADALIAYCKKEKGGSAYTVRYFKKIKPVGILIFID